MPDSHQDPESLNRREFVKKSALLGGGLLAAAGARTSGAQETTTSTAAGSGPRAAFGSIPTRPFGKTAIQVSIIGVGGYHLGLFKSEDEAIRLVHEAMDAGINFMDNAWDYHMGKSE